MCNYCRNDCEDFAPQDRTTKIYLIFGAPGTGKTCYCQRRCGYTRTYWVPDYNTRYFLSGSEKYDDVVFVDFGNKFHASPLWDMCNDHPAYILVRRSSPRVFRPRRLFIVSRLLPPDWEISRRHSTEQVHKLINRIDCFKYFYRDGEEFHHVTFTTYDDLCEFHRRITAAAA